MTEHAQTMVSTAFSGDYTGALAMCDAGYENTAEDYDASFISGYCRFHLNQPDVAMRHFSDALNLRPGDLYSTYYHIASAARAGHAQLALEQACTAIETWPADRDSGEFNGIVDSAIDAAQALQDAPDTADLRVRFTALLLDLDLEFERTLTSLVRIGAMEAAQQLADRHRGQADAQIDLAQVVGVDAYLQTGRGRYLYQAAPGAVDFVQIGAGDSAAGDPVLQLSENPAYVAELDDMVVTGVSSAVFSGKGHVISDTYADATYGHCVDPRADDAIAVLQAGHAITRLAAPGREIDRAINLTGLASNHFGHWFVEYLPRLRHFRHLPDFAEIPLLINSDMPASHLAFLRCLCQNPIIEVERAETILVRKLLVAPTITFFPFDLRPGHIVPPEHQASWSAGAMRFIRDGVLKSLKPDAGQGGAIYLSRKNSSWGKPVNETEFEAALTERSVDLVYLETMSFADQVKTIHAADVIIAPTGSALNMAVFARPSAKIIVFSQKAPHNWGGWLGPLRAIGITPDFITMPEGSTAAKHAPFSMDIAALDEILQTRRAGDDADLHPTPPVSP